MANCENCKYFAVPLSEAEKSQAHCPGANPLGDPSKKICVLKEKPEFENVQFNPENCANYFPVFFRFR